MFGSRTEARRPVRPMWGLGLLLLTAGCVTTHPWITPPEAPPPVCQVQAIWEGRVQVTQDVVNGGRPLPGLAGRLYLFGEEIKYPERGDGTVSVELFDLSNVPSGAQPQRLEQWNIDAVSLSKLLRKDKIGWGYTLFLPWATYRPDITRVQLNLCYTPAKGTPLYSSPATVNLGSQATLTQTRQVSAAPTAGR